MFFTSEVDTARDHFQALLPAPTRAEHESSVRLMTDDGSHPLTPAEVSTLTAEVDDLVSSLAFPRSTPPLIPRAP